MKKFIGVFLAATMALSLAACGGGEGRAERDEAEKHDCGRLLGEHAKSKSGFRLVRTEE